MGIWWCVAYIFISRIRLLYSPTYEFVWIYKSFKCWFWRKRLWYFLPRNVSCWYWKEKVKNCKNYIVSSIERLSFPDESFDNTICVGSGVLNYCVAFQTISELSRVLGKSGKIILEFENSWGYEYMNTKEYKAPVTVITLEYMHEQHIQWLFS